MIRLDAVRLVNWYHFADETLRFAGSCLLLGDNGSGKSTVLDAVQWALVADQQQARFNKAANEHSRRNLYGYVRWKLGSEDETRPGQVRFGRGGVRLVRAAPVHRRARPGRRLHVRDRHGGHRGRHRREPAPRRPAPRARAARRARRRRRATWCGPLRDFRSARARDSPGAALRRRRHLSRRAAPPPRRAARGLPPAAREGARLQAPRPGAATSSSTTCSTSGRWTPPRSRPTSSTTSSSRPRPGTPSAGSAPSTTVCAQGERIAQERRTAESHRHLAHAGGARDVRRAGARRGHGHRGDGGPQAERQAELARAESQLDFLGRERDRLTSALLRHARLPADPVAGVATSSARAARSRTPSRPRRGRGASSRARRAALDTLLSQDARDLRRARPALFAADALVGAAEPPEVVARLRETLAREGSLGEPRSRDVDPAPGSGRGRREHGAPPPARRPRDALKQEGHAARGRAGRARARPPALPGRRRGAPAPPARAAARGARAAPALRADRGARPALARRGGGLPQHAPLRRDRGPRGLPARPRPLRAQQARLRAARPRRGVHRQRRARRHGAHPVACSAAREPRSLAEQVDERRPAGARLRRLPPGRRDLLRRASRSCGGTAAPSPTRSWSTRTTWPGRRRPRCTAVTTSARRPAPDAWTRSPGGSPRCPRRSSISAARPRLAGERRRGVPEGARPRRASCPVWSTRRGASPICAPARRSCSASSTASTGTKSPPSSGSWTR